MTFLPTDLGKTSIKSMLMLLNGVWRIGRGWNILGVSTFSILFF
jgi:hypothetical protein